MADFLNTRYPAESQPATPVPFTDPAPGLERVADINETRRRHDEAVSRVDYLSALILGVGFVASAFGVVSTTPLVTTRTVATAFILVVLYAFAFRTEFLSTAGSTVPTTPVLVAMLFLLPVQMVPLAVLVGLLAGGPLKAGPGRRFHELLVRAISGWHCLGPVTVLLISDVRVASFDDWPIWAAALLSQFVLDVLAATIRFWCLGVRLRKLVRPMAWTFRIDCLLAPVALAIVIAAGPTLVSVGLIALPVILIAVLSKDRTAHLEEALTIGEAFASVQEEARVDPMTKVGNRRAWSEAMAKAREALAADPVGVEVFVLSADLDHLKAVNDRFGHAAGDELITTFARLLDASAPFGATVARLGGDEFGVLSCGPRGSHEPTRHLADLRAAIGALAPMAGGRLSASIGCAMCPDHRTIESAVEAADLAAAEDKILRRVSRQPSRRPMSYEPARLP